MSRFSENAWARVAKVREAIYQMPFNTALADGTLNGEVFAGYIVQDSLYLAEYAKALALAAAKAPNGDAVMAFAGGAAQAVQVERALHADYFSQFHIDAADAANAEPSPTCLAYTSYLLAVAQTQGFAELAAAILPCFWVYQDVGSRIHKAASASNPYRAWIDTYADKGFEAATREVIDITDAAAASADPDTVARMHTAFLRCTQFEWMFWDAAWRKETWPVTP